MGQLLIAGVLRGVLFLLVFFGASSAGWAATCAGVTFPETVTVHDSVLALNGLGTREATVFKVDVYVMALYLAEPSHDPELIIRSSGPKRIVMQFVRAVDAEQLREGWSKGLVGNGADLAAMAGQVASFQAGMTDVKQGEAIVLDFFGDRVVVDCVGKGKAEIAGGAFQQALLAVWLGPNPPNADLKQGILGR